MDPSPTPELAHPLPDVPAGLGDSLLAFIQHHADEAIALSLVVDEAGDASISITWGREAPDSPMAAAQALGYGATLQEAIEGALGEARVNPCARCAWRNACLAETGDPCHS